MKFLQEMGKTGLKAIAAIGSGGVQAVGMVIFVGLFKLDPISALGIAVTTAWGTFATAIAAHATRAAASPPTKAATSAGRKT